MSGGVLASYDEMTRLRGELAAMGEGLSAQPGALRAHCSDAMAGAGEVERSLSEGATTFLLSWSAALEAYGDCCRLLADHVDLSVLRLREVDEQALAAAAAEPYALHPQPVAGGVSR